MKPFDPKAALAGAPVVTVSGEPVTGLHWFEGVEELNQPIAGVLDGKIEHWHEDGRYFTRRGGGSTFDLRMAED